MSLINRALINRAWSSACVGYTPLMALRLETIREMVKRLGQTEVLTKTNHFDEYSADQLRLIDQITGNGDVITVHTHVRHYNVETCAEQIDLHCQFYTKEQKPTLLEQQPNFHNTFFNQDGVTGMNYITTHQFKTIHRLDIAITEDEVTITEV